MSEIDYIRSEIELFYIIPKAIKNGFVSRVWCHKGNRQLWRETTTYCRSKPEVAYEDGRQLVENYKAKKGL